MRKRVSVFVVAVLFCLVAVRVPAEEKKEEIRTVKASGSAQVIKENTDSAKKEAIQDAKRNAVDQIGSQVISESVVENFSLVKDRIISKVDGYVHSYKILEEKPGKDVFSVTIEAEVSKNAIMDDALIVYQEMAKPRMMIFIPEVHKEEIVPSGLAENTVSEFFISKGFTLVDKETVKANIKKDEMRKVAEGDEKAAAKLGLQFGAEVVITGTAIRGDVESVRGILYSGKAAISVRVLRTDNAALYSVSNKSESAADGIGDAAQRKAMENTAREIGKDVFWKIIKKWNEEKMNGMDMEMVVSGISFSQLQKFKTGTAAISGISEVVTRSFDAPTAVLGLKYKGDANRLAEILDSEKIEGLKFEILSVSQGKINLRVK